MTQASVIDTLSEGFSRAPWIAREALTTGQTSLLLGEENWRWLVADSVGQSWDSPAPL